MHPKSFHLNCCSLQSCVWWQHEAPAKVQRSPSSPYHQLPLLKEIWRLTLKFQTIKDVTNWLKLFNMIKCVGVKYHLLICDYQLTRKIRGIWFWLCFRAGSDRTDDGVNNGKPLFCLFSIHDLAIVLFTMHQFMGVLWPIEMSDHFFFVLWSFF